MYAHIRFMHSHRILHWFRCFGVLGSAWFTLIIDVKATVIYTPVTSEFDGGHIVTEDGFEIDFNDDGVFDARLRGGSIRGFVSRMGSRVASFDVSTASQNFHAANLQQGDAIAAGLVGGMVWAEGIEFGGGVLINSCRGGGGGISCSGNFFQSFPFEYLGVEFQIEGALHYGWVELESLEDFARLEIHGFAYEDQPGVSIIAGQIPEPSVALLWAMFGSVVLLRRRRR